MKKKILISTGGSGGHVIPGICFYQHLKENFDISITLDKRGLNFINLKEFNYEVINTPHLSKNIFKFPINLITFLLSIIRSFFYIKKKNVKIVISTGGYMSLPICIAARILNCKIFLFEPNMVIGRSNLIFLGQCDKIFCYHNEVKNFPDKYKYKIELINPLLKKEIYSVKKNEKLNFNGKINLLIVGGSQGAEFFQNNLKSDIVKLSKKFDLYVSHQTNFKNYESLKIFYQQNNIKFNLFNFEDSISKKINQFNLCITRSGASSLAEFSFLNIPFITIPFPKAKDNHQFYNALYYKKKNLCWMLNQSDIYNDKVYNLIIDIVTNSEDVKSKITEMQKFSYQNSWNNINKKLLSVLNK